ncbi:TIM barrel protein [Maribacter algarum]|uniref:TIM barrel protein n=1 Tax=Maribacter algarum (ex Zhang et al. 2020) TaxID=2578118 RepID=A0A5S3PQ29_9FLAO|nr:TIM barrel protein [Maribacter algarum]TMM56846.1 TIM barrel protein [Maribacter algarum]
MKSRRTFIKKTTLAATAISMPSLYACGIKSEYNMPKISLAQWSLNRSFFSKELNPVQFANLAKNDYGISAVEYVNQFYADNATNEKFWNEMTTRATDAGVQSLIMMVDEEEKLGDLNTGKRKKAVEDHYKWVNAAKILGCHSVRVNAFGEGSPDELEASLIDGLGRLTEYAAKEEINVIIENHGLHTSNASFMTGIIKAVDNSYLGTLPDFGNWCLNAEWGSTETAKNCTNIYPSDVGLREFLPYAKGVSAKSYAFDSNGNETVIEYPKLLKLVKESKFDGHIGIEFEGENMSEPQGIKATKNLIERVWKNLM